MNHNELEQFLDEELSALAEAPQPESLVPGVMARVVRSDVRRRVILFLAFSSAALLAIPAFIQLVDLSPVLELGGYLEWFTAAMTTWRTTLAPSSLGLSGAAIIALCLPVGWVIVEQ